MQIFSDTFEAVGSRFEIYIICNSSPTVFEILRTRVFEFENNFSRFIDGNQLDILNSDVGKWQTVSSEMLYLLSKAKEFYELTNGTFNVSVIDALEKLGYDKNYSLKTNTELADLSFGIEFDGIKVKIQNRVEFGGFGKGYMLDVLRELLIAEGFDNFLINAGGDIYAYGNGPDGNGWRVLFEHPSDENMAIGECYFKDKFLASSNANKRKWDGGHHLLSSDGTPSLEILATYVQGDSGILVDAMATAIFVQSLDNASEFIKGKKFESMYIDDNFKIHKSSSFNFMQL